MPTEWEIEILEEMRAESMRSARYFLVEFISHKNGHVQLVFDSHLNFCRILHEDWFDGADEIEYHYKGNELISRLLRYGYA